MFIERFMVIRTNQSKLAVLTTHTQSAVNTKKVNLSYKCVNGHLMNITPLTDDIISLNGLIPFELKYTEKNLKGIGHFQTHLHF